MSKSKVYWMDAHSTSTETSLVAKMTTVSMRPGSTR